MLEQFGPEIWLADGPIVVAAMGFRYPTRMAVVRLPDGLFVWSPVALSEGLRAEVEARTDALADVPWAAVGTQRAERLVELVAPVVAAIAAGDGFLPGNPMALRLLPTSGGAGGEGAERWLPRDR